MDKSSNKNNKHCDIEHCENNEIEIKVIIKKPLTQTMTFEKS